MDIISSFKKIERHKSFGKKYRVASVDEVEQLLKAIIRSQSNDDTLNIAHELLPQSKNEVFSLKDGYLFDFGTMRTFYPDIDKKFLLKHKLGVLRDFPEVEGARVCLPLALLHACADEEEEEIRDLVMVQSVNATFGQRQYEQEQNQQVHEVPRRSMSKGFAVVQDSVDDEGNKIIINMDVNYYPGLWGCRRTSSDHASGETSKEVVATDLQERAEHHEQPQQELGYWPPANLRQTISPKGAKCALLNAYTMWPKRGGTALHFAAATRRTQVVKLLLALELEVMQTQVQLRISASTSSQPSVAAASASNILYVSDFDGNNPVCCAAEAQEDNSDVLECLLLRENPPYLPESQTTLYHKNNLGMTALLIAASRGHMKNFCCLLQHFSNRVPIRSRPFIMSEPPFFESLEGKCFLHYCVERASVDEFNEILGLLPPDWDNIVQFMLNIRDNLGETPLEVALKKGRSEICKLVLEKMNQLIKLNALQGFVVEAGINSMKDRSERDCDGNNILHLYALGNGSREVGEQLTKWVKLLELSLHEGRAGLFSCRLSAAEKDLYIGLNTMEAMINQLNCAGETPCITAVKRGHTDALQVLMPFWTEELASRYVNPDTGDTFLHCCVESSAISASSDLTLLITEQTYTSSFTKALINTPNQWGRTPITCSLHSGKTACLAWFLKQTDVQIQPSDHALHVYADRCDDEEVAKALLAKLGPEQVQAAINDHLLCVTHIEGTPLMIAIAHGHLGTCRALLAVDGIKLSFESNMDPMAYNVLHFLCANKSANIEQCWEMLATAKVTQAHTSDFLKRLINAKTSHGDTPLKLAVQNGNTKACEWLLAETRRDLLVIDPDLDAKAILLGFRESGCMDMALWKNLTIAYCKSDPTLLEFAKEVLTQSLLNAMSRNPLDFMQCCFMMDKDIVAILDNAKDVSFWWSYFESLSRLKCFEAIIEMNRNKNLKQFLQDKKILHLAAKKGNFVLFEMVLQAQSYEKIEDEFNKDQYQDLLTCVLYSPISIDLVVCLIQEIQKENCSSLIIAWRRFLESMGEQDSVVGVAGALMRAHRFLAARKNEEGTFDSLLSPSQAVEVMKRVPNDPGVFAFYHDPESLRKYLCIVRMLCEQCPRGNNPIMLQQEEAERQLITPGLLEELLLTPNPVDNPQLVIALLLFFQHMCVFLDTTMLTRVIDACSTSKLHSSLYAILHFVFTKDRVTTSQRKAFLTSCTTSHAISQTQSFKFPILIALCVAGNSMAMFIKVLNFAQSCQAEGMTDSQGKTALHHACETIEIRFFYTLVCMCPHLADVAASCARTPLMLAVLKGSSRMVEYLLPLTRRGLSFERDADGRTLLHYAAMSTDQPGDIFSVVKLLVSHARQDGDLALLLWAMHEGAGDLAFGVANDHAENTSVKEFLQNEIRENQQMTPSQLLKLSIDMENSVITRDLINRGADISTLPPEYFLNLGFYETKQHDRPATKDSLGRESLAKAIASLFLNPLAATPITVGVLGGWGMGKSSLMLQIEIILMMTIMKRNLLSSKKDFPSVIQDKLTMTKVKELQLDVLKAMKKLTHPQQCKRSESQLKMFFRQWTRSNAKRKNVKEKIEDFVSVYRPECMDLYKGLAMMSRYRLFQCPSFEKHHQPIFTLEIPSCITIYYNAWLYHGESNASSGLALTILKEFEKCMNTAQWLKLCWSYAYRLDPVFVFSNITLPLLVLVTIGGWIVWIIWKLMSLPALAGREGLSSFKYGSIPVSTVIIAWIILRNIVNVLKPVSEQIIKSINTSQRYEERLGYQHQIINDIQLFKDHLQEGLGLQWKVLGKIWNLFFESKDNIPKSSIKKVLASKEKLRIIIFIDDLDRCSKPEYVLELLGATNLVLSTCAINVVLGVDKDMIKEVISKEYNGNMEAMERFLEKIIHVPIELYDPSVEETSSFLEEQLMFGKSNNKQKPSRSMNGRLLISHGKTRKVDKTNVTNSHFVSNDDTLLLEASSRKIQNVEGDVTIDLRQESHSNFGLTIQERKESSLKIQREGSKLPIHDMEEEKKISRKYGLHDLSILSSLQDQDQDQHHRTHKEGYKEESNSLVVEIPPLVAIYNETEVRAFKELQKKARAEQKKPRNWKRLLSYHQIVRSVISKSEIGRLSHIYGWQEKLIIWLFLCYNWKEQMNKIFENWEKLVTIPKSPSSLPPPSLHNIIQLQMKWHENSLTNPEDLEGNLKKSRDQQEWSNLERTLYGAYDVDVQSVNVFQKYRFHCSVGHIYWENGMVLCGEEH